MLTSNNFMEDTSENIGDENASKRPSKVPSKTEIEEKKSKIEEKSKVIKIFIHNGGSYHGKAIVKELKRLEENGNIQLEQEIEPISTENVSKSTPDLSETVKSEQKSIKYQIISCFDPFDVRSEENLNNCIDSYIDQDMPEYENIILDQDILIYDTNFDISAVNEALEVIKLLENWAKNAKTNQKKKRFLLISNLMTWAMTENNEQLSNIDYRKRRPHPCYRRHLRLEQEITNLQTKFKDKIETLVLCPGITFGYEEDILHYFFKMSLYNKQDIEMFGCNEIPLIHVTELAEIIKKIIDSEIIFKQKYLLAFNPFIKYQNFVLQIAKLITGNNDVRLKVVPKERMLLIDHNLLTQRSYDKLTLNLNMVPSNFDGFQYNEDFDQIISRTVDEYYESHDIKPIKIIINGPPSCGKTTLAKALSCYYAAQYINPDEILEDSMLKLEKKVKKGEEYLESTEKSEILMENELFIRFVEETKEKMIKWKEEIRVIKRALESKDVKSMRELKEKYLTELLTSNACTKNQGYVIDNLLYDIEIVEKIFLVENDVTETIPDKTLVESHIEIPKEKSSKKKVSIVSQVKDDSDVENDPEIISEKPSSENLLQIKENLRPDIFIYLKWDESILKKEEICTCREFKDRFPVENQNYSCCTSTCTLFGGNSTSDNSWTFLEDDPCRPFPDFQDLDELILGPSIKKTIETHERRRLESYLETEYEDQSLYIFMLEHGVIPFEVVIDLKTNIDSMYLKTKEILGPRNEYLISDARREEEKRRCEEIKRRAKERKEAAIRTELEKQRLAREKQLKKEEEVKKALRKKEIMDIEACSLPLRKYLIKYIVPKLTEGLVEVARVRPQDPIDYLAEYLFRNNPDGQMFNPNMTDAMMQKILDERLVELQEDNKEDWFCHCLYDRESCDDDDETSEQ